MELTDSRTNDDPEKVTWHDENTMYVITRAREAASTRRWPRLWIGSLTIKSNQTLRASGVCKRGKPAVGRKRDERGPTRKNPDTLGFRRRPEELIRRALCMHF